MRNVLSVRYEQCTGCRACEIVCSFAKSGAFGGAASAIMIEAREDRGLFVPVVCQQCEDAPCVVACPTGAMSKDEATGIVSHEPQRCVLCLMCIAACPLGAVRPVEVPGGVMLLKCDLCGGSPKCTEVCYTKAVELVPIHLVGAARRQAGLHAVASTQV